MAKVCNTLCHICSMVLKCRVKKTCIGLTAGWAKCMRRHLGSWGFALCTRSSSPHQAWHRNCIIYLLFTLTFIRIRKCLEIILLQKCSFMHEVIIHNNYETMFFYFNVLLILILKNSENCVNKMSSCKLSLRDLLISHEATKTRTRTALGCGERRHEPNQKTWRQPRWEPAGFH